MSKREKDFEDEIVNLKNAIKEMKIPRLGAPDVDKLFAGAKEYHKLEDAFNFLKKRMAIFAGLISRQFDKLRSEGVSIDN